MKKIISGILAGCLALTALLPLSACGKRDGNDVLRIGFAKAGYGDAWLNELIRKFEAENEGVKVETEGEAKFTDKMLNRLENETELNDLMFGLEIKWQKYAVQGKLEPLDDIYAVTDGEGVTLEQRLKEGIADFCRYEGGDGNEHYYVVPWSAGSSGLVYNETLLNQYNLKVPTTTAELKLLCTQIETRSNGAVKAFVYPGRLPGYWNGLYNTWWAQYDGVASYYDFHNNLTKEKYFSEGRKKAIEAFAALDIRNHCVDGSESFDHIEAQIEFLKGTALMIPTGSWWETESEGAASSNYSFKMMKTPYIDNNHKEDINWTNSGDCILIPAKAKNKELAKKFLEFMNREENMQLFTRYTGAFRPFEYDIEEVADQMTNFGKSVEKLWSGCTNLFSGATSEMLIYITDEWKPSNPFGVLLSNSSATAESVWKDMQDYVGQMWPEWERQLADLNK